MSLSHAVAPVHSESLADAILDAILDAPEFQSIDLAPEIDPADAAWDLGFRLGREWDPATCGADLPAPLRVAFLAGFQLGRLQAEEEALAELHREFEISRSSVAETSTLLREINREPGSDWPEAERVAVRGSRAYETKGGR